MFMSVCNMYTYCMWGENWSEFGEDNIVNIILILVYWCDMYTPNKKILVQPTNKMYRTNQDINRRSIIPIEKYGEYNYCITEE